MAEKKVWIVEDEAIIAMDLKRRLQGMGYTVLGISGYAEDAIEKIREYTPDLVMMDIILKGEMDGITAAEIIRRELHIPVVYLTAYDDESTVHRVEETEPFGYIIKPFEEQNLRMVIEIALHKEVEKELEFFAQEVNQYAQELQNTTNLLSFSNRKRTVISEITLHDILNKIMTIQGCLDLAADKKVDSELAGYLNEMQQAVTDIQKLIRFTREYEKLGAEERTWVPVSDIITTISDEQLPIRNHCSPLSIFADPMLEMVFANLMDNTLRHAEGATEVNLNCETNDEGLLIIWEDDGTGIPEDQKEKIFEKGSGKGDGFGLFLAREILSLSGITTNETGMPGKGARFEIMVPNGAWRIESGNE
ncbi:hybrid sensor histidine kinase/response regulator [Methanocalculus chunghsingensis]|uniref:hybrid sensor histidine kinase/response regulator n=1 Tax=Methanocalculus chunghsingensis TaxID=156457 RepID=UPI001B8CC563|nr:response regulator [Methanocalculus chunghsingensis]